MSGPEIPLIILRDTDAPGSASAQQTVLRWWQRLCGEEATGQSGQLPPYPAGVRAILRRAEAPDAALLTEGFRHLWLALPGRWRRPADMRAWGCVAAALAEVRRHDSTREFAAAMAQPRDDTPGAGKPRVSELRFAQLQRSADLDELLRRTRRVLRLLDQHVNVLSLADSLLHWHREKGGDLSPRPDRRLAVRWATAYFEELARH